MLKMFSNSVCSISNNVKGIQSFEKGIKLEYLKKAIASCGFILLQETHSPIHDEKKGKTSAVLQINAGHHKQKNKKNHQSNLIFGGHNKTTNKASFMTFSV